LLRCPHCEADLTSVGSVLVQVTNGTASGSYFKTRLLPETGDLVDSDDGLVAKGFHSETSCARCQESLVEWEEPRPSLESEEDEEIDDEDEEIDDEDDQLGRAKLVINNAVELRRELIEKYGPAGEEIYDLILEHGEPIFGVVRYGD
jgi:hypothetical protein